MLPDHLKRDAGEVAIIKQIALSGDDRPVLMLNMNCYKPDAGYPDKEPYRAYISGLRALLETLGAKILWQLPVDGQVVGTQEAVNEALGIWYPSHGAFLELVDMPGARENYRLRALCVDRATIHRCAGSLPAITSAITSTGSVSANAQVGLMGKEE